jgi:PAS domain S-box-containing protein
LDEIACLAQAAEMAAEAVVVLDGGGRALSVTSAFERITGYPQAEVLGRKPAFLNDCLYGRDGGEGVRVRVACGESWSGRLAGARKDGTPCDTAVSIAPVRCEGGAVAHLVVTIRDETQHAAVEALFRQAQKMEAIGRLAAGIAHDFNNQLTVILGYSDLLLGRLPADDPARKNVEQIHKATERAGALAGRLLSLGRKHAVQSAPTSLNEVLQDIAKPLARVIGEDIALRVLPAEGLGLVEIDRGLFEQAVMNLVINARDAMPQGGEIEIATANVEGAGVGRHLPPGDYACVTVRDTGTGIDAETLTHIFDPFFTTKADGHGTGLGLAMVYSFVKQSRGFVYVESEPGKGTTFFLYFRLTTAPVPASRRPRLALAPRAGTETVLVAEDDEDLRALTVRLLHDCGYNVLAARNPQEALSLGREYADAIDVLITDVVMPGMSGPAMAAQFRGTHHETRVLYVSGHARGALAGHGLQGSTDNLLAKPFGYHTLAEKVRQIIDSRRAASGGHTPQTRKQARKIKVLA